MAPILAANNAWEEEKHKVTLTLIDFLLSVLQAIKPFLVKGTLITILLAIFDNSIP